MAFRTMAILVPGEMGAAVGGTFHTGGLDVVTCLEGLSDATRELTGVLPGRLLCGPMAA